MRVLKTPPGWIIDVAFSPDCRAVACAMHGPVLFLWNLDSPTIAPVRLSGDGAYLPGSLRFSPDTRQLTWRNHDSFRRYDRDSRTTTAEPFPYARGAIWWSASDDGTRAVCHSGLPDHCLTGWRLTDGEWVRQWKCSTRELFIGSPVLAPAGDRFAMFTRAAETEPWRLEVRDAATSALLAAGSYPYSYAGKLALHPQGEQVAALNDMTLLAWALPEGGEPRRVHNDSRKHFTALAYHPNGRLLFVTSNDETVHAFDTNSLERVNRYTWQLSRLSAVAVSPDGTLAAAGSLNGDVVVWDLD
jgi:WD40 repeat protein